MDPIRRKILVAGAAATAPAAAPRAFTQQSGRRGDGAGGSTAGVYSADWSRRSCHVLLRKRPRSHSL